MEGMTFAEARDIAEGLIEYDDPKIIVAAWQFLIDNNMIRRLDEWFKSSSEELIELGICRPPQRRHYSRNRSNRRKPRS